MTSPNQIEQLREDVQIGADDLLTVPQGHITEDGLRTNIDVGIQYMAAWLDGNGCVPIYNLMEDAATAEISRAQLWQWVHNPGTKLADGRSITPDLFLEMMPAVMQQIEGMVGQEQFQQGKYQDASKLFEEIIIGSEFTEFLTLPAYEHLN